MLIVSPSLSRTIDLGGFRFDMLSVTLAFQIVWPNQINIVSPSLSRTQLSGKVLRQAQQDKKVSNRLLNALLNYVNDYGVKTSTEKTIAN